MLTRLLVRNFKRFHEVEIELASPVLFVGPNNAGKTTALQAISLWATGLDAWLARRDSSRAPRSRPGVVLNRQQIVSAPIPNSILLWRGLHVSEQDPETTRRKMKRIRVEVQLEGDGPESPWKCGLEFDYSNSESLNCRPMRLGDAPEPEWSTIPKQARAVKVAFLLPMSGISAQEFQKTHDEIDVLMGQGRTAEVLRNLCLKLQTNDSAGWDRVCGRMFDLFGIRLAAPVYIERQGIQMTYRERNSRFELDLSSAGRGLQQTLLLLTWMGVNPGSVLLLDEPDAHLEFLRQRQLYSVLTSEASRTGSQLIAASHSEVLLSEAGERDTVIAFVGKPHRVDNRGSQVLKSLKNIGFDQYVQAEQTGWVLYLEGSTDLAVLRAFAELLEHEGAKAALDRPHVVYVANSPNRAMDHFYGLKEAKPDLISFALFDNFGRELQQAPPGMTQRMWRRREIENYVASEATIRAWVRSEATSRLGPLFVYTWDVALSEAIKELDNAFRLLRRRSMWDSDVKVTDDVLNPLFANFFERLGNPNVFRKTDYHVLTAHVPRDQIDPEVIEVLDAIAGVAAQACPAQLPE